MLKLCSGVQERFFQSVAPKDWNGFAGWFIRRVASLCAIESSLVEFCGVDTFV